MKSSTRGSRAEGCRGLNYQPNLHARSLAGGRSRSLGVIVSNIENPFFLDIYKSVEIGARAAGYDVIMANTDYAADRLVTSIRMMIGRRVAGLARHRLGDGCDADRRAQQPAHSGRVLGRRPAAAQHHEHPRRLPRRDAEAHRHTSITSGTAASATSGHHVSLGPIRERVQAVRDAARALCRSRGSRRRAKPTRSRGGRRAARSLLERNPSLTALICVNDLMAVGALARTARTRTPRARGCLGHGLRQRHAGGVIGFRAASVDIPRDQIGRTICECLISGDDAGAGAGVRDRSRARGEGVNRSSRGTHPAPPPIGAAENRPRRSSCECTE